MNLTRACVRAYPANRFVSFKLTVSRVTLSLSAPM